MEPYRAEFYRYHSQLLGAVSQVKPAFWYQRPHGGGNSIAVIVQHLTGNLMSRYTDFLTSDGEKPWRQRDEEFETQGQDLWVLAASFDAAWIIAMTSLAELTVADRLRTVTIRGQPLSVEEALCRSVAHLAYHVGEVVQLARAHAGEEWKSLSIPPGESRRYATNPTQERANTPGDGPGSLSDVVRQGGHRCAPGRGAGRGPEPA